MKTTRVYDPRMCSMTGISIYIESVGVGDQNHRLITDEVAWHDCVKQPNFRACYDLSMARLVMQQAILGH